MENILWSECHGVSIVLSPSNQLGMHVQFTHTEKSSLIMAIITALLCSVIAEEIIFPWQITYCFITSIYIYTQCMGTKWNSALFQNHKIQCAKMHVSRFVHLHFLENRIQHQLGQLWNFYHNLAKQDAFSLIIKCRFITSELAFNFGTFRMKL